MVASEDVQIRANLCMALERLAQLDCTGVRAIVDLLASARQLRAAAPRRWLGSLLAYVPLTRIA